MRRFLFRCLTVTLVFATLNVAMIVLVPADRNGYLLSWRDKTARLDTLSQPRVVLVGGSSVAFGTDSRMLADSLHCGVVNMGLHAGLGIRLVMDEVLTRVRPGDVVVAQIEYGNFFSGGNGEAQTLPLLLMATGWNRLAAMNATQRWRVVQGVPHAAFANLKRLAKYPVTRSLDTRQSPDRFVYARSGFNELGDEVSHWRYPPTGPTVNAPSDITAVDSCFMRWLKGELERYERAGAVVVMVPPVTPRSNFAAHYHPDIAAALERIGHPYAVSPESMVVPDSMAFDGGYHITREGAVLNTRRLIRAIALAGATPSLRK